MTDPAKEYSESCKSLVKKGRLLLTVDVRTEEEADQILTWMYGTKKPMGAALQEISWDKATVSQAVADAVETLKKALQP